MKPGSPTAAPEDFIEEDCAAPGALARGRTVSSFVPTGPEEKASIPSEFSKILTHETACMEFLQELTNDELHNLTKQHGPQVTCSFVQSPLFRRCITASIDNKTFMKNETNESVRQTNIWNFSNLGFSVARTAVETKHISLLDFLTGTGLDINIAAPAPDNKTLLMQLILRPEIKDPAILTLWIDKMVTLGADINFINPDNKTALDFLPENPDFRRARELLREKYGAKTGAELLAELVGPFGSLTV